MKKIPRFMTKFILKYKNFIIHLETSDKGNASHKIDEIASNIIKISSLKFQFFFFLFQ